ncbi:fungal pheromone STE3G-protein-coupled receptor [Sistotremastrum suecicum HHB10207 ss-3]|uniref:Fungal pheromone STE3G-protein-coupled receptor n=1 Tax=Sistotremastrum suecicum HHB10207 ss-3 TaxID=1314776 RepID=A0A166CQD7_9AGAM|nr:fungal pheromone STE3G-protein-coupled receptor [Sistotremastrum suecicum HHB10207 ss-3]
MLSNVYAVLSFLGLVFVLIPLPWNLRSWNVGVCALIFNVALGCLVLFVNHIIWSGTVEDKAPAWCDISAKLLVGIRIGVPAACLCITRRLFSIIRGGHSYLTQPQRTRVMLVDLALSAGVPLLIIALHCIVQSHRFDIIEDVGCWPATFNSIAAYPLVLIWPLLLSFGSCIYYLMCTYIVFTRRASIPSVLDASSTVTTKQLYRLLALLAIMLLYLIPSNAYLLWLNARLQPFLSQSQANYDFPRVDMLPSAVWETNSSLNIFIQMNVWVYSGFAFLISALLALTPEAYECYRTFLNHLGCRQLSPPSKGSISRPRWLSW